MALYDLLQFDPARLNARAPRGRRRGAGDRGLWSRWSLPLFSQKHKHLGPVDLEAIRCFLVDAAWQYAEPRAGRDAQQDYSKMAILSEDASRTLLRALAPLLMIE